jgi:hypothetical protein
MDENGKRVAMRAALRQWGRRQDTMNRNRDPLVLASLAAGVTREEIHFLTRLGRTTIDRIAAKAEAAAADAAWDKPGEAIPLADLED